jgi:hypothetical protein
MSLRPNPKHCGFLSQCSTSFNILWGVAHLLFFFLDDGGVPTRMQEFLCFPTASGNVNLAEEISTHYEKFGIFLLEDDTGDHTEVIVKELRGNAVDITEEVFRFWLEGNGLQPVSWATLIGVLKNIGLTKLAYDIQQVMHPLPSLPPSSCKWIIDQCGQHT